MAGASAIDPSLAARIAALLGSAPRASMPLHGGCIAAIERLELADGTLVVAKRGHGGNAVDFRIEAFMLQELKRLSRLPVPAVLAAEPDLLLLEYLPHDPGAPLDAAAQEHAAELVAALHEVRGPAFGYGRDTLIGPLPQPNAWMASWVAFFRERRLLAMTRLAHDAGTLPMATVPRLERLAHRLEELLEEPPYPSLLHGDLWAGNILLARGRVVGFVDPAIHFGHPEVELAFGTLFGSFGEPFFRRYRALRGLAPGFFERRRDLYNLYPLLVHVRLFGASYLGGIERTLKAAGF
jgi:fructosamine-3-kinase